MSPVKGTFRNHCFDDDDDGLASIAEIENGFNGRNHHHQYPVVSRPFHQNKPSFRNVSWGSSSFVSSPRSHGTMRSFLVTGNLFEEPKQTHFLDSCFLCKKSLGGNKDIFMYRGDTPFCSEECRQEQIEMDESEEKSRNLSASVRALRIKEQIKTTSSATRTTAGDRNFRSGTVAAAS